MHVNGFVSFMFDGAVDNASGGAVIGFDRSCWLWVTGFEECGAEGNSFLGVEVEGGDLCLGGDAITFLMTLARMWMGPLKRMSSWLLR